MKKFIVLACMLIFPLITSFTYAKEGFPDNKLKDVLDLYPKTITNYNEFVRDDMKIIKQASGVWSTVHPLINLHEFNMKTKASSILNRKYPGINAVDRNPSTAWVEGKNGNGVGEWLSFKIDANTYLPTTTPFSVERIGIIPGYAKNQKTWSENNRVKSLLVVVYTPQTSIAIIPKKEIEWVAYRMNLKDESKLQIFEFPADKIAFNECPMTVTVWLKIEGVYKGTKYDDTCISEVVFIGGCSS